MDTLFPIARQYPKGFSYVHDFIDPAAEVLLLKEISQIELHSFLFQGYQAKRRVASFVQRRSLYVLRDEARTDWQHSTQPMKAVRYAITLRTLRSA